ncbi:hypothetical protein OBBRIDRAFT_830676 [Obba rivulosa]|uniref:Uncharacterized protein n=1 Tax=Obba rivulosa TaxID=1052685 RepID=A0A8E2DU65_9APHY|nr:hypothetical protein OBBRIDRAFT_830676 [Obba rivulosa]
MSDDEYAPFYDPDIEAMFPAELDTVQTGSQTTTLPPSHEIDEFDAYDFSEFTGEELAGLDAVAGSPYTYAAHGDGARGGPSLEIVLEGSSNISHFIKAPPGQDISAKPWAGPKRSPYDLFRRKKGRLSVSDVVGLAWCEVQFDYGLRQGRSKKLKERPKEFVTASGKTIAVDQTAAAINDRITKKGQAVHKTLEREIRPEEVEVELATLEEEWALKLVKMLACLQDLVQLGYCREMPVFGVLYGQVISGIIDELVRIPAPEPAAQSPPEDNPASTSEATGSKRSSPSTPSKSKSKKSRKSSPQSQSEITSFFASTALTAASGEHVPADVTPQLPETPPAKTIFLPDPPQQSNTQQIYPFTLHLSDTKTRRGGTIPSDEDTLPSRLQLMLYRRLLSNILAPAPSIGANQVDKPLDFDAFWLQVGVDPVKSFSKLFMAQTGLMFDAVEYADHDHASLNNLNALVTAWRHSVDALGVNGVDKTLTLRYRAQPHHRRRTYHHTGPLLSDEEKLATAKATETGFNAGVGAFDGRDRGLAQALGGSLESGSWAAYTLESAGQLPSEDLQLQWALQNSFERTASAVPEDRLPINMEEAGRILLEDPESEAIRDETGIASAPPDESAPIMATDETQAVTPSEDDSASDTAEERVMTVEELEVEAHVIGMKEFVADDAFLDEYLASALQYWYGQRPPRGVDIAFTRRCMSCEYREGCEWREQKAEELEMLRTRAAQ